MIHEECGWTRFLPVRKSKRPWRVARGDWVFGDPKRAGDLIGPLADSSGRRAAVRALIEYYQAVGDADSASKWVKALAGN
jgi:hypothetical protein